MLLSHLRLSVLTKIFIVLIPDKIYSSLNFSVLLFYLNNSKYLFCNLIYFLFINLFIAIYFSIFLLAIYKI